MNPGTIVNNTYRIERKLGEGGMAVVYEVTQIHLGARYAMKVLHAGLAGDPTVVERFIREARAAVKLASEHVVKINDVFTTPTQQPCMVMELLDGTDLDEILKQRGTLPPNEAVDYTLQACEALAEAHAAGIVHRDIKPANCVLARRNDGSRIVKVLDFGIAKLTLDDGPKLTATSTTMGTPAFMSPEQIKGAKDVDHRGDIWSLGVSLFHLLVGKVPFMADTYGRLVMTVMRDPTPPMPDIPPALAAVVNTCLAKDRAQRYQTIGDLAVALEPFAGDRARARQLVQNCLWHGKTQRERMPAITGAPPPAATPPPAKPVGHQPTVMGYASPQGLKPAWTPPMSPATTPAHGMPSQPAHGYPYGTNPAAPAQGMSPMTTPAHGMSPMTTPAHGMPPASQTAPVVAPPPSKSGLTLYIIVGVLFLAIAGVAVAMSVL